MNASVNLKTAGLDGWKDIRLVRSSWKFPVVSPAMGVTAATPGDMSDEMRTRE
jgi:hypothetical protein